jgi:uncharacterized membrane protein
MQSSQTWRRLARRVLTHPVFEVGVVVAVILLAAWSVISTEALQKAPLLPLMVGR